MTGARWLARGAAAALLAVTGHAPAAEPVMTFHTTDPAGWGSVRRLVEPAFPRRALAEGRSGYVDVRGRVDGRGNLVDIEYSPEDPGAGVFVDPIRLAIRHWEFQPPLGDDCQPSAEEVANRVWFEAHGGRGRVSVSPLRPRRARSPPTIQRLRGEIPRAVGALRGRATHVYTRLRVDELGAVVSVEPRIHAVGREVPARALEHEIIRVLSQWQFPASPGTAERHVCVPLRFAAAR